jgi:L-lysine 2,3-aminomutase
LNIPPAVWQQQLAAAFSNVEALCRHLEIEPQSLPLLPDFKAFPLRVPRGFVDCMERGNPADPLLRQVLPIQNELNIQPGYSHDPVGDLNAMTAAGVVHKYHGRVLLIVTGGCAVHCRYCFRRHFPYGEQQLSTQKVDQALAYLRMHDDVSEVILSGGDPLLLNDEKLGHLLTQISAINHVRRIRIHSRVPVVLPSRVTEALLKTFMALPQQLVLVIHANHGNELSNSVAEACLRLRASGITLLNQSVLLKDVNDDVRTLCHLSEKLLAFGVMPYYLHMLDRAMGTGHFEVPQLKGKQLLNAMQECLPGYLVPRLVTEQAGAAHKISLA